MLSKEIYENKLFSLKILITTLNSAFLYIFKQKILSDSSYQSPYKGKKKQTYHLEFLLNNFISDVRLIL